MPKARRPRSRRHPAVRELKNLLLTARSVGACTFVNAKKHCDASFWSETLGQSSSNDAAPAIDELIERADKVIARATTYKREIDAVEPLLPPEHPDLLSKFLQAQAVAVAIRAETRKLVLKLKDLKLQEASSTVLSGYFLVSVARSAQRTTLRSFSVRNLVCLQVF